MYYQRQPVILKHATRWKSLLASYREILYGTPCYSRIQWGNGAAARDKQGVGSESALRGHSLDVVTAWKTSLILAPALTLTPRYRDQCFTSAIRHANHALQRLSMGAMFEQVALRECTVRSVKDTQILSTSLSYSLIHQVLKPEPVAVRTDLGWEKLTCHIWPFWFKGIWNKCPVLIITLYILIRSHRRKKSSCFIKGIKIIWQTLSIFFSVFKWYKDTTVIPKKQIPYK